MQPIVSVAWLKGNLADVVVCHVAAQPSEHDLYLDGHIPGARSVSLDDDLAVAPAGVRGRHPLPTAEAFADTLSTLGIGNDDTVVAYDTRGGAFAARLVWMLRVIGQDAALLDGGVTDWSTGLEAGTAEVERVSRQAVPWPADSVADADDVARHIDAGGVVIDSREAGRYRGEFEPIDTIAGHIPGAVNRPFADNLTDGHFRSHDELSERFSLLDDTPNDATAIVYCGSGVTACHNALTIEHVGVPRPRVYVGSWSGWTSDQRRSVARGE